MDSNDGEDDEEENDRDDDDAFGSDWDEGYCQGSQQVEGRAPKSLTTEELLMCSASLRGYSLKNKKWLVFSVASVKDIRFNEGAFESLVLPEDHKELILALTESQAQHKDIFDDVIQGKGRGMIMLLSGPPGVGKTLTAESGKCRQF